jgi:hypothetical protein
MFVAWAHRMLGDFRLLAGRRIDRLVAAAIAHRARQVERAMSFGARKHGQVPEVR